MPKEGRMPKKICQNTVKVNETKEHGKGYRCKNDPENSCYPFPCPLGNFRGCTKA